MADTAVFVGSNLTGSSGKYKYEVKVSGSSFYDEISDSIVTDISYSIQAINKITGQACPLCPYSCSGVKRIEFEPDALVTEYTIDIDNNNVLTISKI